MTKLELGEILAESQGWKPLRGHEVVEFIFEEISQRLIRGEAVTIQNFAVFEPRYSTGTGRKNPMTGEKLPPKPFYRAWGRMMLKLNTRINANFKALEKLRK